TVPHELNLLVLENARLLYHLLFTASAATLLTVAADPQYLGAEIGILSILHTWGQNLLAHSHIHCVIPAGGIAPDRKRWVHPRYSFLLPVKVLSRVFRGKFVADLKRLYRQKKLRCAGPAPLWPMRSSFANYCVVSTAKTGWFMPNQPSAGPDKFFATWAATPIAWPSPTIDLSLLTASGSPSVGKTTPTAASNVR
ncbi:MAG TPA: transposase, partial [Terriglobia bacterium]|nr:transposase [Terriglobia bacterium]